IHGGDVRRVVTQEGAPSLTWRSLPLDHVLGHRRLGDLKSELEQLAVNAWRAPQWVLDTLDTHPPNQCAQVRVNLRPPSKGARLSTRWKPSIQLDKEQAIAIRKPDAPEHDPAQHNNLVPERSIFGFKSTLRLKW